MKLSEIARIYKKKLPPVSNNCSIYESAQPYRTLRQFIPSNLDSNILDAGCGNGIVAKHLNNRSYTNIFTCDLFDNISNTSGIKHCISSLDALPFQDNSFEFVYSLSVIYYLKSPQVGINEIIRVLKPGGRAIITAHTKYSLPTVWRILKRILDIKNVEHLKGVTFYSASQLEKMVITNDARVIKKSGYSANNLAFQLYKKLVKLINRYSKKQFKTRFFILPETNSLNKIMSIFAYHSIIIIQKNV
ncbi:class I SAM-dependent methyltransferase [Alkalimarinus alittae]|uniref:Class I SAM-dependent methyltransferase n=1 Tax=Alkalimarinus alittae TaxID=2961619 RepID=A0ABY6MZ86_9ALTE|nr:class I SAM-dependent methyltransferase [Alkalimarinus alittae]UZE95157.1 class I SAM-dependent methyltransferase [Alkalimarinus alittae]